ncbi:50S ribosomal protein L6 [Helicobacter cetorum]|uniref:Large ribosomal subunit protein uL6 n=1 Tax=Helicobacter cetorum (strain ATCC BAA-429 / MIT 00-7128) TaxID=182217 RepID=I0EKF8_HELC0|nr:50S ribosomal protein L6 [Helicobacter cetorum]AFI03427.1 50S ribosomal protein L6 [Helicobacter cetorum MIT 00-7128]
MSRIGKRIIEIPSSVQVNVEGSKLLFKNSKEKQELETHARVKIVLENNQLSFQPVGEDAQSRAYWGTYGALANNIVIGLSTGFSKSLEVNGVGYKVALSGKVLDLSLGFSHPVKYPIPEGIEIAVEKNVITIKGSDKQKVGQVAAEIRSFRPPEPYKGKGVKYSDEVIIRKAGKTAKK